MQVGWWINFFLPTEIPRAISTLVCIQLCQSFPCLLGSNEFTFIDNAMWQSHCYPWIFFPLHVQWWNALLLMICGGINHLNDIRRILLIMPQFQNDDWTHIWLAWWFTGNPAWECICTQNSWLVEVLSSCVTEHTNREHDEVTYGNSKRSRGRARSLSSALLPRKDREEKVSEWVFKIWTSQI